MDLSQGTPSEILNLELLAKEVVEGFITGMHKSPFHGFSVEFSEHKLYNKGESTRHIDWKLFAKTEKLYTKKYEEETNLRCHLVIDNSASMHYPILQRQDKDHFNKIGFAAMASASLIALLKKQRDAVGLSIYSDKYEYYAPERGSERHRKMLYYQLEQLLIPNSNPAKTNTYQYLHEIAEKMHRRSLIFVFTDMFQTDRKEEELFEALRHLKYNKHEVILFHTYDAKTECNFDFDDTPKRFVDVETGESVTLYTEDYKNKYQASISHYFENLQYKCLQYKIDYVPVDIHSGFDAVLTAYFIQRKKGK